MDDWRTILSNIKVAFETLYHTAKGWFTENSTMSSASECIRRAENAYYAISKTRVHVPITSQQLIFVIRSSKTAAELYQHLKASISLYDEMLVSLLFWSILTVTSTSEPLTLSGGGFTGLLN